MDNLLFATAVLAALFLPALLARRAARQAAAERVIEEARAARESARRSCLRVDPDIGAAIRPARRREATPRRSAQQEAPGAATEPPAASEPALDALAGFQTAATPCPTASLWGGTTCAPVTSPDLSSSSGTTERGSCFGFSD